ncbi:MAG TPA: aminoacyl-tRNA hydrolase [Candidatus Deferrimicrobium sp.]|nr:aminoacyl-tRNA hydrolase [Candidatus Kapabacteria bacterium]HLP61865.1 aminoacyl-tRNA hydrolase [Candidatus Deferrimicrobium sp.]
MTENGDKDSGIDSSITLVAALGNPGNQYAATRHNIAQQLIEKLSFFPELEWQHKFKGEYSSIVIGGRKVYFLAPLTYMNLSGESLQPMMQFFRIPLEEVLVIHDELELDFGVLGFKQGGGLAGHNGLRSIAAVLGTRDFKRMRLGISRPAHTDITSYVLGNFSPGEQAILPTYLEEAAKILEICLVEDFNSIVKKYRKQNLLLSSN